MISFFNGETDIFQYIRAPVISETDAFTSSMFTITPHSCFVNFPCRTAGSASGTYIQTETVLGSAAKRALLYGCFSPSPSPVKVLVSAVSMMRPSWNMAIESAIWIARSISWVMRMIPRPSLAILRKSCNALTAVSKSRPG